MATAAAIKPDVRARSVELAQAKGYTHCSWAAHRIGYTLDETTGELVNAAWMIDSATSDAQYAVTYVAGISSISGDDQDDLAECECKAAQYGRPCWHAGLGYLCGRYLRGLFSPAGRAEEAAIAEYATIADENARALGF